MKKIISGLFYRLLRSIEFWGLIILIVVYSLYTGLHNLSEYDHAFISEDAHVIVSTEDGGELYMDADMIRHARFMEGDVSAYDVYRSNSEPLYRDSPVTHVYVEEYYALFHNTLSNLHVFPILLIAIFIPVFFGRIFSDGTLKNLIACGHKRGVIYLSSLLLTFAVDLAMYVIELLIYAALCLIGGWLPPIYLPTVLSYLAVNLLTVLAVSALIIAVLFIFSKRTTSFIVGFIAASMIITSMPSYLLISLLSMNDTPDINSVGYRRYLEIIDGIDREYFPFYTVLDLKEFRGDLYYEGEKIVLTHDYFKPGVKHTLITLLYLDPNMAKSVYEVCNDPYLMQRDGLLTIDALSCLFWITSLSACGIIIFKKKEIILQS